MHYLYSTAAGLAVAAALAAAGPAFAETVKLTATLSGAEEVPPVETSATGSADIEYDTETMILTWTAEYSGLSGDVTSAHFHGPAAAGEIAPPVAPLHDTTSGITESLKLSEQEAADLMDGLWYLNYHTFAHNQGEIRGQVLRAE